MISYDVSAASACRGNRHISVVDDEVVGDAADDAAAVAAVAVEALDNAAEAEKADVDVVAVDCKKKRRDWVFWENLERRHSVVGTVDKTGVGFGKSAVVVVVAGRVAVGRSADFEFAVALEVRAEARRKIEAQTRWR